MQFIQGKYHPRNPQKYVGDINDIVFRSSWERKFMIWCDTNPYVINWTSEYPIPYFSQVDNKIRRYFIDFLVKIKDRNGVEKTLVIEIKPQSQTVAPAKPKINNKKAMTRYINECITYQTNLDKWRYAKEFAQKNGFEFLILTEKDLGINGRRKK